MKKKDSNNIAYQIGKLFGTEAKNDPKNAMLYGEMLVAAVKVLEKEERKSARIKKKKSNP